ncbi:MAG: hypothetical protein AAF986_09220, partial [Pseudomonadota bacterium]
EEFVKGLRLAVTEGTASQVLSDAADPSGRNVTSRRRDISAWLKSLDHDTKLMLEELLYEAADSAVFGFLCALDGVRKVTNDEGNFELRFVTTTSSTVITRTDDQDEDLHDVYGHLQ